MLPSDRLAFAAPSSYFSSLTLNVSLQPCAVARPLVQPVQDPRSDLK